MRTPLGRVRGLGSAREGTGDFWMIRLTSVAGIPLTIFFVALIAILAGKGYQTVTATLASPAIAILLLLSVLTVVIHMRLGMQEIIVDYVHAEGTKVALLMLNTFFCVLVGFAAAFAILKIAFGV